MQYHTPLETVDILTKNGINKVCYPFQKTLLLGILAGLMIAFGADAYITVTHAVDNMSLARMLGGMVFAVGLICIVLTGCELLTGSALNVLGISTGKISWYRFSRNIILVLFANAIGAVLLAVSVFFIHQLDASAGGLGAYTMKLALGKIHLGFGEAVVSGIWCNVLVCLAVMMAAASQQIGGKVIAIYFPISTFVICGFEHSVANMFYLPLGLLAKTQPAYVAAAEKIYGITASQIADLTLSSCLLNNLVPVVIGNLIGGSLVVAGTFFVAHKKSVG